MNCDFPTAIRTATFWATQPDACGSGSDCAGNNCGVLGLSLVAPAGCVRCDCCAGDPATIGPCTHTVEITPRTILNTNWLRGLALNMLNTDARKPNSACGVRPGALAGHWSESYNNRGPYIGTHLRELTPKGSLREVIQIITLELKTTLAKLVTYGVATKVDVVVAYRGNATLSADVTLYTSSGAAAVIGLTAQQSNNTWAWQ